MAVEAMLDWARREANNAWNTYVGSDAGRWQAMYDRGLGVALDGPGQRARHYVIAGMIADACGRAPAVLDVGCGVGTTYAQIRALEPVYTGLDLSSRAIACCRERFGGDPGAVFDVAAFERWTARRTFDAVVLNEVLQYFPFRRSREVIDKAVSHLSGPRSLLVVSLCDRGKARLVRLRLGLGALPPPIERVYLRSRLLALFGGRWVVAAYAPLAR